jgi:hypothetical protein
MSNSEDFSMAFGLFSDEQRARLPLVFQIHGDDLEAVANYFNEDLAAFPNILNEFGLAEKLVVTDTEELKTLVNDFARFAKRLSNPLSPILFWFKGEKPIPMARASHGKLRKCFERTLEDFDFLVAFISLMTPLINELRKNHYEGDAVYELLKNLEAAFKKASDSHLQKYLVIQDCEAIILQLEKGVYWLVGNKES